jgi:hypothetical protein
MDPTGGQKFSVPLTSDMGCIQVNTDTGYTWDTYDMQQGLIIAGDGYAYVPYRCTETVDHLQAIAEDANETPENRQEASRKLKEQSTFRQRLLESLKHPAQLAYLDWAGDSAPRPRGTGDDALGYRCGLKQQEIAEIRQLDRRTVGRD